MHNEVQNATILKIKHILEIIAHKAQREGSQLTCSIPDKRIILKQSDQIVSRVPLPIFLDLIANLTLFCRLIKINCLHSPVQCPIVRSAASASPAPASKQMAIAEASPRLTITQAVTVTRPRVIHNTSRFTLSQPDKNKYVYDHYSPQ